MPRPRPLAPSYCHDKATNRAYVRIDGRKRYLGAYDSKESRVAYAQIVSAALSDSQIDPRQAGGGVTVSTIIGQWIVHAEKWYGVTIREGSARPSGEAGNFWTPLRVLKQMFGELPAPEFGPRQFKELRAALARGGKVKDPISGVERIYRGHTRESLNRMMARVRSVFRWAVEEEWIPGEVLYRLRAVRALAPGRGEARETEPVISADQHDIERVLPHLSRHVGAMVRLQRLTAMRPGELCSMLWTEIDRNQPVWVYRPTHHKTKHKGKSRFIHLGPRCQEILNQFLPERIDPSAYVFSPAAAEAERNEARRKSRQTPMTPSQARRAKRAAAGNRRRGPGECYSVDSYRRSIERACEIAFGMPAECRQDRKAHSAWLKENKFRPNQLRHTGANETAHLYSHAAVQLKLGHSSIRTTEIYLEPDLSLAEKVARESG